jgi:uncharacterized protein YacL (UPF0231 family)
MQTLKLSAQWEVIKEWLQESVEHLNNAILVVVDDEFNKVKYNEHDLNRIKRAMYIKLSNLPDEIINYYDNQVKEDEEESL